jgi:hypothetical protein
MAAALVVYVVLHSPLRDPIAMVFGLERRTCYFCLPPLTGFDLPDSLAAGALLLLATVAAWAVADRCSWPAYERVLLFGLATVALVTVPAAFIGGLASLFGGTYLRPPAGLLLAAIPALALIVARGREGWRPSPPPVGGLLDTPLLRAIAAAASLLLVAEVAVTLLHPPSQGDALTYHAPLGVLFWTEGDLTSLLDRSPETWGLTHPGTAELWYGAIRLLGGERLANLGQVPFAFLGAAAVYAFTRRTGLLHGAAALAAGAFFLVPMVALQLGTQANDLAGAALVMTAVAFAAAPAAEWRLDRAAVLGLALGLAGATKLALIPSVAAVGVFVLAMLARSRGQADRRLGAAVTVLVIAFLVPVTPWWVRNIAREGNPLYPQSLPVYGHGVDLGAGTDLDFDFVERRFAWPVYPIVEPIDDRSGFGALLAMAIVPGLTLALRSARRQPVALYGLTLAVTLVFWWVYSHHEPRFLLAYAGLGLALLPWALLAVPRRQRPLAVGLVIAGAAFSVAVIGEQQLVPLARQPVERASFYDRVYGVDPAAQSLPEEEGLLVHTGYGLGPIDYTIYYPLLGPAQERLVALLDADTTRGSRTTVVRRMRRHGLRYAYVQAVPRFRDEVERLFSRPEFRLVHTSAIVRGERIGVRRTAFRHAVPAEADTGIRRYLFRLVRPDT